MTSALDPYTDAERALWSAYKATPSERYVGLASGLRVRVQELGAGPPALFVHGVMTAGSSFAPLVAHLPTIRAIVLDRPGCGLSAPWRLQPEFREQAVGAIREVVDALELDTLALVGNSLGALWATWFALAHPTRVSKLVLVGPSIGFPGVRVPGFMRIASLPGIGALIRRKMRPTPASLRRIFAAMGHSKSLDAGKIPDEMFEWGTRLGATGTQRRDFESILRATRITGARPWIQLHDDALRSLSVPTLLIAGTDDTHGGPALASRAATLIPHATVQTVADAGHIPWVDDPPAVAEPIQRFVRGTPG
jgi:pimeloyl-ACP methyl ester carboxylesterase